VLFDISFVSAERHAHIPTTRKDQVFSSTLRVESPSVYSVARKNAARVHHQDAHPANARGELYNYVQHPSPAPFSMATVPSLSLIVCFYLAKAYTVT